MNKIILKYQLSKSEWVIIWIKYDYILCKVNRQIFSSTFLMRARILIESAVYPKSEEVAHHIEIWQTIAWKVYWSDKRSTDLKLNIKPFVNISNRSNDK